MAPLQRRPGRGSQDPRCGGHWAASLIHPSRPSDRWVAALCWHFASSRECLVANKYKWGWQKGLYKLGGYFQLWWDLMVAASIYGLRFNSRGNITFQLRLQQMDYRLTLSGHRSYQNFYFLDDFTSSHHKDLNVVTWWCGGGGINIDTWRSWHSE